MYSNSIYQMRNENGVTRKEKTRWDRAFISFLMLIFIYMYIRMESYYGLVHISEYVLLAFRWCVVSLLFAYILLMRKIQKTWMNGVVFIFWGITITSTILNRHAISDMVSDFPSLSLWFASFIFFMECLVHVNEETKEKTKTICCRFMVVYAIRFGLDLLTNSSNVRNSGAISTIYYALTLLPVVFLLNGKQAGKTRAFLIALVGIVTVLSAKRAAFLAFVISLIVPVLFSYKSKDQSKKKKGILAILLIGSVVMVMLTEQYNVEIKIFERLSTMVEDGGSNRDEIYELVWNAYAISGFPEKLIGRGFNGVATYDIARGTSAHNDFLEVLVDYGAVGLFVYVAFVIVLCWTVIRLYKMKSEYFECYLSTLLLFLIMSFVSHLILYPTYIVFLLIYISFGVVEVRKNNGGD